MNLRERDREHPGRVGMGPGFGLVFVAQALAVKQLGAARVDPARHREHLVRRRRAPCGPALVIEHHRGAARMRHAEQRAGLVDEALQCQIAVGQVRHDLERQLLALEAGGDRGGVFLGLDLQRQQAAQMFASHAGLKVQVAGRVVVARNQAPKLPAHDDRDRHRRQRAHVAHVLQVHRRNAAQAREREVERAGAPGGVDDVQRHRVVVRIRDQPDVVQAVELARLRRDVARRESVAGIGVVVSVETFGEHLGVVCLVEPIGHAAPEAGEALHFRHRQRDQFDNRRGTLQLRQQAPGEGVDRCLGARLRGSRLELDDHQRGAPVHRHIECIPAEFDRANGAGRLALGQHADAWQQPRHDPAQRLVLHGPRLRAGEAVPVVAVRDDLVDAGLGGDQPAMRLDRTRNADRFVCTVVTGSLAWCVKTRGGGWSSGRGHGYPMSHRVARAGATPGNACQHRSTLANGHRTNAGPSERRPRVCCPVPVRPPIAPVSCRLRWRRSATWASGLGRTIGCQPRRGTSRPT